MPFWHLLSQVRVQKNMSDAAISRLSIGLAQIRMFVRNTLEELEHTFTLPHCTPCKEKDKDTMQAKLVK